MEAKPIQVLMILPPVGKMLEMLTLIRDHVDHCMMIPASMFDDERHNTTTALELTALETVPQCYPIHPNKPCTKRKNTIKRPKKLRHLQPQW
jgi:hypothetical protein